jgi:hypothetical protein
MTVGLMTVAYSQSLADVAKQERERRKAIKNVRIITFEEAGKSITEPVAASLADDRADLPGDFEETAGEAKTGNQREKTVPFESLDFLGRPESYWRKTMSEARQRVRNLENERNALILKQNRLQNDLKDIP